MVFSWDLPWADLVKASSEFKNKESWITCRACLKWFRRPSAFKQHLLMKVGVGQHPTSSATGRWDFNEMWDGEYEEYVKSLLPQQEETPPVRAPPVPRDRGLAERFAELEALGVPAPPLPPPRGSAGRQSVVKDADWFLWKMLEEEIARSEFHLASEDAWVPFVDDISQRLVKGLSESDRTRDLSCSFPQIEGDNKVDFKVNMRWSVEDILAHLTSKLGLQFLDLGSRWCIRLIGIRTVGNHKTFHLEIFFSPGKGENGLLRSVDPIPDTVKALFSPERTEESVLVDEIPPEGEGTRVAPVGEVEIRSPSAQSRAPIVALSHGLPAAVSGAHAYFDELVPDLMAAVPTATGGQTFAAQPVVKRTPVAPPTGEGTLDAGRLKSHLFSKLRFVSEIVCEEPKVQDRIGRLCSQILDQFEGHAMHVDAFVELMTDLVKLLELKKVVEVDKTIPLQAHLLLAQHGFVCHGESHWPVLTDDWSALLKTLLAERPGTEATLRALVEQLTQKLTGGTEAPPVGDAVSSHGREQRISPEEELRVTEATQDFAISSTVEPHSLFSSAPDTSGNEVVRTKDSWSRPGAYMERFAVFVDGVATVGNKSGVLGHAGFPYMCVLCGAFSHGMGLCHEKPCCEICRHGNPSLAEVNASWRLRGAQEAEVHHVPWLGMSSPPRGDSVDSPEIVIQEVKNEFLVSSIGTCNLRSNVCVDLVRPFHLGPHLAFEVVDTSGEGIGVLVFDEWYRDHFDFFPHQRFWIAGLTLWGSLKGVVIHFLHPPHHGFTRVGTG